MNCLILFLLNLIYLVSNTYPKHILEFDGVYWIVAISLNLVFYCLVGLFSVIAFHKNKNPFSQHIFFPTETFAQKVQFKRILLILAFHILLDGILLAFEGIWGQALPYVTDLFIILQWVGIYCICARKETNIFIKKPAMLLTALAVLLASAALCNFAVGNACSQAIDKYRPDFAGLNRTLKNMDFLLVVKGFLLDTLAGLSLLILHTLCNRSEFAKQRRNPSKEILRVLVVLVVAALLVSAKAIVFPYSCFKGLNITSSAVNHQYATDRFYAHSTTTTLARLDAHGTADAFYETTSSKIYYNGKLLLAYQTAGAAKAHIFSQNGNVITMTDRFEELEQNGVAFCLYDRQVICYIQNGAPTAIHCEDTKALPHDPQLVSIYRALIEKGNWNFFEQGANYLLSHDEAFMIPSLQKYAEGQFTDPEIQGLRDYGINKAYIEKIADLLLNS